MTPIMLYQEICKCMTKYSVNAGTLGVRYYRVEWRQILVAVIGRFEKSRVWQK